MSRAAERGVRAAGPGDAATPVATPAATGAATHAATGASTDPEAHRWGTVARVVAASPESLAAAVAGFSIGPMILLLFGHLTTAAGVSVGCAGALIALWFCGLPGAPTSRPSRLTVICTVAAAAFAVGWILYNVRYTAQDVYATRDPATYTISGRWLVDHASLQIHTRPDVFGSPAGSNVASGSYFNISSDIVQSQGNHLLPALLGLSGGLFGASAVFSTNVVVTALALFVFFGLARRVVAAPLALVAMLALGLSMPVIYVGRDNYTEPLTLLFLMGSLALLHRAFESRRLSDFALAGLVGGTAAIVRIDSYGALIALVLAAILVAALGSGTRADGVRRAVALLVGTAATAFLGWLDVTRLSGQYYRSLHGEIVLLLGALLAFVALGPLAVRLAWRPQVRAWLARERTRRRITTVAGGLLVLAFAVLVSRPAWLAIRGPRNLNLENMQRRWNHPVDGSRLYDERTVHWLALYLGWPTIVLAVIGYVLLIGVLVMRRAYALAAMLTMGLTMSALYLWSGKIAPDQPWAMRRYVPVIMPLLLVAAVAALHALWQWRPARLAGRVVGRVVVVLATAYLLTFPLRVTWPMRHVREEVPQLRQVQAICSAVGPRGAVVEVDGTTIFGYGQTLRSFCNVPTIGLPRATPSQLADMNKAVSAHGRTLYVLSQDTRQPQYAPGAPTPPPAFSTVTVQRWPNQINVAPELPDSQTYTVFLSTVDAAGIAHPVAARR